MNCHHRWKSWKSWKMYLFDFCWKSWKIISFSLHLLEKLQFCLHPVLTVFIGKSVKFPSFPSQKSVKFPSFPSQKSVKFPSFPSQKSFFFRNIDVKSYRTASLVIKLILTMSPGQGSVEREFSVSNLLVDHMEKKTIVARKHIIRHMKAYKLKPYD